MHKSTPVAPRNFWLFSQTAPAACDSGSAKTAFVQRPSGERDNVDFDASPLPPALGRERAECSADSPLPFAPAHQHRHCQRTGAASMLSPVWGVLSRPDPASAPAVSRRAPELRWRLLTAGFHSRLPANCACSLFFPRSVGFGPAASCAKGALTIEPSILCHAQAIPSNSSYSARPFRHRRTNTPFRFHAWKYLWIELALPYRSSGKAFHWHPVRKTYTIPSNTFRESSRLRPPPGFRRYLCPLSRLREGTSGSTFAHRASDTDQERVVLMPQECHRTRANCQYLIYG